MKIIVVGSGAREHALAKAIASDERAETVFVCPGNGGTALEPKCRNVNIKYNDIPGLLAFAREINADLTVVGPEEPLALGVVDEFEKAGLAVFGPRAAAAKIEASKAFAKDVMKAAGIPTADYAEFSDYESAAEYVKKKGAPIVVKADGLAAGKGVTVARSEDESLNALKEIFLNRVFGDAGSSVVIEEFMDGEEATYLALTDGNAVVPLDISQDHKPAFDGDLGPNTGGMGAYAPAPIARGLIDTVTETIAAPMIKELSSRGIKYKGVIYAGLMIKDGKAKVVEFNCRFGDPECETILANTESGLLDALLAVAKGNVSGARIKTGNGASACVVLASGGYPGSYRTGFEIKGLETASRMPDVKLYHAGTRLENGRVLTAGGRVLCVAAKGKDIKDALEKAYGACAEITFENMHYRKDIGAKAFKNEGTV